MSLALDTQSFQKEKGFFLVLIQIADLRIYLEIWKEKKRQMAQQ